MRWAPAAACVTRVTFAVLLCLALQGTAVSHSSSAAAATEYFLADMELLPQQAGVPYAVKELKDLDSLITAHSTYQTRVLSKGSHSVPPRALVVQAYPHIGLGNRLPSIATGFVMALFTGRILLIDATAVLQHIDLPFPADWQQHKGLYSHLDCSPVVDCKDNVMYYCSKQGDNTTGLHLGDAELLQYRSYDYDMPLLQINQQMAALFDKFFPDGEVFNAVARHLFQPAAAVTAAMRPYLHQTNDCAVGLHMRRRKRYEGQQVQAEHFADIARMLARSAIGSIFLASDADVFGRMQQLLGQQLWWSNLTSTSVVTHNTTAGNPGTELSAFVDMFMLTKCEAIVVSPASSFGCVAAGIAGVRPVYAAFGAHEAPFVNPWFWQSITSEPCMYKAGKYHGFGGEMQARLRAGYALYLYQTQCHY